MSRYDSRKKSPIVYINGDFFETKNSQFIAWFAPSRRFASHPSGKGWNFGSIQWTRAIAIRYAQAPHRNTST
jgi:hypothetical protein